MSNKKYSLVTVAYAGDIGFMHLQARSVALKVPRHLLEEIIIIENTPPSLPEGWHESLRKQYGILRDLVKFVPGNDIASLPKDTGGWFSQQVLKLMAANIVKAEHYLILDAKNHFIFPLTRPHIERDGKPRTFTHGYLKHPLRRYLDPILSYFKLPAKHNENFLPTTPPFICDTALVREMIDAMKKKEKRPFEDIFLKSPTRFTEFFMIAAYILFIKKKFEDFYDLSGPGYSVIWTHYAKDDAIVKREIDNSEKHRAPLFSVHRGAFPILSQTSKKAISDLWVRCKLFKSQADALKFLDDPNTHK